MAGDTAPSGAKYFIAFDPGHTGIRIRDNKMVRGHNGPANHGPYGSPILMVRNKAIPTELKMSFIFDPGSTAGENAVIGTCPIYFGDQSVQFMVSPTEWQLFGYGTGRGNHYILAQGHLPKPLVPDGHTVHSMSMTYHRATSAVVLVFPGGHTTVSSPLIRDFWGIDSGFQIRVPHSSDGDGAVTWIETGPAPLPAPSTLSPSRG